MAPKIAVVIEGRTHFESITATFRKAGRDHPICFQDGGRDSVEAALELQAQGVTALISAGSYGKRIRQAVSIPVVLIKRSRISFAMAAKEAMLFTDHIAIIGRNGIFIDAAEQSRALLPEGVLIRGFEREDEIPPIMEEFHRAGVEAIIGGPNTVEQLSVQYGFKHVSVLFEERDIMDALMEAEQIVRTMEERLKNAQVLKTIQNSVSEGIVAADGAGTVIEANQSALEILDLQAGALLGRPLGETVFRQVDELGSLGDLRPVRNQIVQLNGQILTLSVQPITVNGALESVILTFNKVEQIQKMERDIRTRLHSKGHVATYTFERIIGSSEELQRTISIAKRYARVESTVLICGPSGSGKEVFAQSIHNASRRAGAPFVVINCAALPESLLESILFGYEKGAFTGARSEGKRGLFELAHGGTVFLDEISEMPLSVQARFLRVLQEKEVMPVGGDEVIPVDIRVLCATNKDLMGLVRENKFREDLYYRICVLRLNIAPLDRRRDDIKNLANFFLYTKSRELGLGVNRISPEAMERLCRMDLPGNVRQLANLVERAIILCDTDTITLDTMAAATEDGSGPAVPVPEGALGLQAAAEVEGEVIRRTLDQMGGSRSQTARALGISPSTLWRKMKRYGLGEG